MALQGIGAMDDLTYEVLSWLAAGNSVFMPRESTAHGEEAFRGVEPLLHRLRDQRLITYVDGHITQTQSGIYLIVGPVHLTPDGRSALERDLRSGERPQWKGEALPWRV